MIPERFSRADVQRLLTKYPNLYPRGFSEESPKDSLLDPEYFAQIQAAALYVDTHWTPTKHIYRRGSASYGLKHVAEAWLYRNGIYKYGVCNGALIAAALLLGYRAERDTPRSPNARFNVSRRSYPSVW